MLTHVVVFWTDRPDSDHRNKLLEGARHLIPGIPGVENFHAGHPVPSTRGVVDDSFSLAISVDLPDTEALDAYLRHPDHQRFVEEFVRPLVKRFVVYDFES